MRIKFSDILLKTIYEPLHIRLRPLEVSDAALTFEWRNSPRAKLLNRGAQTVGGQIQWIMSRPESEMNFIIEDLGGTPLGTISLVDIDLVSRRAEAGRFLIGDEFSANGKPVALEALNMLYDIAFNVLKLHKVYGYVSADNTLMVKFHKYMGLKVEGQLRDHYFRDGKFLDCICIGLLGDEYVSKVIPRSKSLINVIKAL